LDGFGAQREEGRNLRGLQHPKQGTTQPVGGVMQCIDRVLLSPGLPYMLTAFGGLDLFSDSLWEVLIFVLLIIVSAGSPF